MAKLPESRNLNLPRPPAAAAPMRPIPGPPPPESGRGNAFARSFIALIVIGGLLTAGIVYYMRGVEQDVETEESLRGRLHAIGKQVWEAGYSEMLIPVDEEAEKDYDDLPRVIAAVRQRAQMEESRMDVSVLDGDPPPGKGTATHQIRYFFNGDPHLIVRVRLEAKTGAVYFLGEANRVTPSRAEWEKGVTEVPAKTALPPPVNRKAERERKQGIPPP